MSILDHGHYRQQIPIVRAVTTDGYGIRAPEGPSPVEGAATLAHPAEEGRVGAGDMKRAAARCRGPFGSGLSGRYGSGHLAPVPRGEAKPAEDGQEERQRGRHRDGCEAGIIIGETIKLVLNDPAIAFTADIGDRVGPE